MSRGKQTGPVLGRSCTGLRNKGRLGVGSYSRNQKRTTADSYGTWKDGRRLSGPENIARHYENPGAFGRPKTAERSGNWDQRNT